MSLPVDDRRVKYAKKKMPGVWCNVAIIFILLFAADRMESLADTRSQEIGEILVDAGFPLRALRA